MIRFVCVNVGPAYSMDYVEILADMVARNATLLERCSFECVTDRPAELPDGIGYIPANPDIPPSWWAKLQLFSADMPWEEGDRIVYFDLDVAITGRLEELTQRKGIIGDWLWEGCYNSSVMVWDHGEHRDAWETFTLDMITAPGPLIPAHALPKGQANGGDQEHLTALGGWDLLPDGWCLSYRVHAKAWPPNDCRVVVFHGRPKPHEVTDGWVPDTWKIGGLTALPVMQGVNVTRETILDNVRASCARDLEWFTGLGPHSRSAVLVCGAPSMLQSLPAIRDHQRRGARIITVNNAWRVLVENGIKPDVHVMLDARPENADFVKDAPASMRFLIASQCHPDVFDALADREVVLWHNAFGDSSALREVLAPWWETRPCVLVPGGGTVGLRALWLCALSGFKTVHLYGMDSSYADDKHHAYAQPLNDGEQVMEVTMAGKRYRAARWMVRQSAEFRDTWNDLRREGVTVHVHGRGLIPDIARKLRAEAVAA